MQKLTIGKVRGLQQLADPSGIFAICAMDHRGSMQRMINPRAPDQVEYAVLAEYKRDLAETLSPASTAVLLDPVYGASQAIAGGVLRGSAGLLVSLEETGYEEHAGGRGTRLLEGWSVEKIRRMGASGVKVLIYYRPDHPTSGPQREVVTRVARDCRRSDIPFVLEPISYPLSDVERNPDVFAERKPALVVQSAQELTGLGIDVLKAEFPVDPRRERDEGRAREACQRVSEASQVPWVLLSAGASYDTFVTQVRIACRAGASGFLGGRAIWDDVMKISSRDERRRWLSTQGVDRMTRLHDIAGEYGRPWWRTWTETVGDLVDVGPDWYQHY